MFSCATPGRNACTTKSLFLCAPRRFFAEVGYALACHRRRAAKRHAASFTWLLGKQKHTPPAPNQRWCLRRSRRAVLHRGGSSAGAAVVRSGVRATRIVRPTPPSLSAP